MPDLLLESTGALRLWKEREGHVPHQSSPTLENFITSRASVLSNRLRTLILPKTAAVLIGSGPRTRNWLQSVGDSQPYRLRNSFDSGPQVGGSDSGQVGGSVKCTPAERAEGTRISTNKYE